MAAANGCSWRGFRIEQVTVAEDLAHLVVCVPDSGLLMIPVTWADTFVATVTVSPSRLTGLDADHQAVPSRANADRRCERNQCREQPERARNCEDLDHNTFSMLRRKGRL